MTRVWLLPAIFFAPLRCGREGADFLQVLPMASVGLTGTVVYVVDCLLLRSLSRFFRCARPPTVRAHRDEQNLPAPKEPSCFFEHVSQRRSRIRGEDDPARGRMRMYEQADAAATTFTLEGCIM